MGTQSGRENTPLSTWLLREPWRFGFYQGTRLLEWIAARDREPAARTAGFAVTDVSVGGDVPADQEAVRFRATSSARFPADEVLAIRASSDPTVEAALVGSSQTEPDKRAAKGISESVERTGPFQMTVGFFGLTGPNGVLPSYYHRLVRRRLRARDRVLRDFLDFFNHRTLSLFYRAWVKYRFPIAYERTHRDAYANDILVSRSTSSPPSSFSELEAAPTPSKGSIKTRFEVGSGIQRPRPKDDDFSRSLLALVGLGTDGQRSRHEYLESAMLDFAGLFAHLPRSAIGLERILAEHFQLPIQVLQFQGQWLTIDASDRSHLGGCNPIGHPNNCLGGNALLGDGVWDVQSRFRLRIGPLENAAQFFRFLPVAIDDELRRIQQLTRVYVGPELEFDIQLVLPGGTSLEVELGGNQERGPLLGWNVWLRTSPFEVENGDAVFPDNVIERPSH